MPADSDITTEKRKRNSPLYRESQSSGEGELYLIKGILRERKRNHRTEYLVDWEPINGETFEPSWEREVTEPALDEWRERKRARTRLILTSSPAPHPEAQEPPSEPPAAVDESQGSQPPRPANYRRAGISAQQSLAWCDSQTSSSVAPSVTTGSSVASVGDRSPSPGYASRISGEGPLTISVDITRKPDFRSSQYEYLSVEATQSTLTSSQATVSELETQDSQILDPLAPLIYDSLRTIPDSQELFDSAETSNDLSIITSSDILLLNISQPASVVSDSQDEPQPQEESFDITSRQQPTSSSDAAVVSFATATNSSTDNRPEQRSTAGGNSGPPVYESQPFVSLRTEPSQETSGEFAIVPVSGSEESHQIQQQDQSEDMSGAQQPQRSALDALDDSLSMWDSIPDENSSHEVTDAAMSEALIGADVAMPLLSAPLTIQSQPLPSSVDQGRVSEQLMATTNDAEQADLAGLSPGLAPQESFSQPATISPAEMLRTPGADLALPEMPSILDSSLDAFIEPPSSVGEVAMGQGDPQADASPTPVGAEEVATSIPMLVTLPLQASMRRVYFDCLYAHRESLMQGASDAVEHLVATIDQILSKLQAICDFPQDITGTSLEELPPVHKAKYATNANAKFSFVFELLQGIEKDKRVLITARSIELLRLLHHVTEALKIDCQCNELNMKHGTYPHSAAQVTLDLPKNRINAADFDVVICFDGAFYAREFWDALSNSSPPSKKPLVLSLITTYTYEHFKVCVDPDLDALEMRHAIVWGILTARNEFRETGSEFQEPHQIAKLFCDNLNGYTAGVEYESNPMLEEYLKSHSPTQTRSQDGEGEGGEQTNGDNALKRKLETEEEEESKRLRATAVEDASSSHSFQYPEEVKDLLDDAARVPDSLVEARQSMMEVPTVAMQQLAKNYYEMKRRVEAADLSAETTAVITRLEQQLKEYERSSTKTYKAYRKSLEDRARFEREKTKADATLAKAVEDAKKAEEKSAKRIADLESTVARLLGTDQEEGSEETPLAKSERLLKEAHEKVTHLAKRLENAQSERDYTNQLYQTASSAASEATAASRQLQTRLAQAEEEASMNRARIHKINAETSTQQFQARIAELEQQNRERTMEADRLRDELRSAKNGRRETRQSSVPRSPALGMMSPRAPVRSHGGSASRGGSPAPGVDGNGNGNGGIPLFPQTPSNGRWGHLRE